jgi:hypothetical protein
VQGSASFLPVRQQLVQRRWLQDCPRQCVHAQLH